jgi:hypothetical protein
VSRENLWQVSTPSLYPEWATLRLRPGDSTKATYKARQDCHMVLILCGFRFKNRVFSPHRCSGKSGCKSLTSNAEGRTRTGTGVTAQGILSPLCLPFHHPGSEGKSSAERRLIRRSQAVVNMLGTLSPNGSRRYVARRRMYSPQDLPAALQAQTLYENSSMVRLAAFARPYLPLRLSS